MIKEMKIPDEAKGTEKALFHYLRAARHCLVMDTAIRNCVTIDTMFWEIFGDILDGVAEMVGENTEDFLEKSLTWKVLNNPDLPLEQGVAVLLTEYKKNRPAQA